MTEANKIRADVPITLHADVLLPLAGPLDVESTHGRAAYQAARAALDEMHRAYASLEDAERALQDAALPAKRTQVPDGKGGIRTLYTGDVRSTADGPRRNPGDDDALKAAATGAFDRAARFTDRQMKVIGDARDALTARISEALTDTQGRTPVGVALAGEIRAHVKSMKDGERLGFLRKAVEARDLTTVAATLSAPAYLSGLNAEMGSIIRAMAASKWAERDAAQLDAVASAEERVRLASTALVGRYASALSRPETPRAKANRALSNLAGAAR